MSSFSEHINEQIHRCQLWGVPSGTLIEIVECIPSSRIGSLVDLSFVAKDAFAIKGHAASFGIKPPFAEISSSTAPIIERLCSAGASFLAIANMDELALGALGTNHYFGSVPNPRFPEFVSGGSSGGCAAAVAGGCADFAIGTDWGGSTRIPAACCGVFGFKASSSGLPREGGILYHETHDCVGIVFDEVETGYRAWLAATGSESSAGAIATVERFSPRAEDPAVQRVRQDYESALQSLAQDVRINETLLPPPFKAARTLRRHLAPGALRRLLAGHRLLPSSLPDQALALLAMPESEPRTDLEEVLQKFKRQWPSDRILVTPCFPKPFPVRLADSGEYEAVSFCTYYFELANMLDCPACVIPSRLYGVPLQFIGAPGEDAALWAFLRGLRKQ